MSPTHGTPIDAHQLATWTHDGQELALLDVREHGQFGEDHLFLACPLPYSVLELRIGDLVPRRDTRIVLCADQASEAVVRASIRQLLSLGYTGVHYLKGGIEAWKQAGYATFAGVNVPGKAFGERVEQVCATPHITAHELRQKMQSASPDLVVLDGRPFPEYRKMSIPGAICCPNGELALRVDELVTNPATTIVVNCAGRTRSIIGAQTLINLGLPNPILALENGTQGWFLADLPLEHQATRHYPDGVDPSTLPARRDRAQRLAARYGIPSCDCDQVRGWLAEGTRTLFFCDVRSPQEAADNPLPAGVRQTPGGQLIQATDHYLGVHNARVVLIDQDGIRAPVVATWLKQAGWDVCLLDDPQGLAALNLPAPAQLPPPRAQTIPLPTLADFIGAHPGLALLDARPSRDYRQHHLAGAQWTIRPRLLRDARPFKGRPILLLGSDAGPLTLLARDLEAAGYPSIFLAVIDAGWLASCGLDTVRNDTGLTDADCIDYLFFVHDRHDGNKAAARQYLAWETQLLSKLDAATLQRFRPGAAPSP